MFGVSSTIRAGYPIFTRFVAYLSVIPIRAGTLINVSVTSSVVGFDTALYKPWESVNSNSFAFKYRISPLLDVIGLTEASFETSSLISRLFTWETNLAFTLI